MDKLITLPYGISSVNIETFKLFYAKIRVRVDKDTLMPPFANAQVRTADAGGWYYVHIRWITSDTNVHSANIRELNMFLKSVMQRRLDIKYGFATPAEESSAMDHWFEQMEKKEEYDRFMQDLKNEKELNAFESQSYEA
jgi:hypothetical protein